MRIFSKRNIIALSIFIPSILIVVILSYDSAVCIFLHYYSLSGRPIAETADIQDRSSGHF
jgi:hypothetical protein